MAKDENAKDLGKYKITLQSGKVVTLKELTIDEQRAAAQEVGSRVDSKNEFAAGVEMQYSIAKLLIVSIDGKILSGKDKELLKDHLNFAEYNGVMQVIQEMMGKQEAPKVEFI